MKARSLVLKILALANACVITTAFVGCPARRDPSIVTIAPPPFVTIAPYGGNIFHQSPPPDQVSPPSSQTPKNEKSNP